MCADGDPRMRMGSASPVAECRATSQQGPAETEWGRLRRPRRHDGTDLTERTSLVHRLGSPALRGRRRRKFRQGWEAGEQAAGALQAVDTGPVGDGPEGAAALRRPARYGARSPERSKKQAARRPTTTWGRLVRRDGVQVPAQCVGRRPVGLAPCLDDREPLGPTAGGVRIGRKRSVALLRGGRRVVTAVPWHGLHLGRGEHARSRLLPEPCRNHPYRTHCAIPVHSAR